MNTQTCKYTDDGKKVIVIAPLNAKETIVQEIFVSAGQEIPSGENFVAKNLHDAPAISWKEKNLSDLEKRYERRKSEIERGIEMLDRKYKTAQRETSAFIKEKLHWRNNINVEALDTLFKFLNDEITYLVKIGCYSYEIAPFKVSLDSNDRYDESLKLISLYGSSEGNLDWKLHSYSDGSGGKVTIIPCCSIEEAHQILINHIRERSSKGGATESMIDAEKKYGIQALTPEQRNNYYLKYIELRKQYVEKLKKDILDKESEIEEFVKLNLQSQVKKPS